MVFSLQVYIASIKTFGILINLYVHFSLIYWQKFLPTPVISLSIYRLSHDVTATVKGRVAKDISSKNV